MTAAAATLVGVEPVPARSGPPTNDQVITLVNHLVHMQLEIERGLRPPQHLAPYLTPAALRRSRLQPRSGFPHGGPVHPRDIGTPRLTRYPDGRIYASVTTREQGYSWGALVVRLEPDGSGKLAVSELERVPSRPLAHQAERPREGHLQGLLEWVEQEREIVEAAHLADQASAASASIHATRLAELDRELAALHERIRHRKEIEATKHTIEAPPRYVTKLIGEPPPHDKWWRLAWDSARDAIEAYREHYGIDDTTALGPPPTTEHQQEARAEVSRIVRTAQQSLRDHNPELTAERRVDRTPALER